MKRKFYIVFEGRTPGIYEMWEECKAQVHGFSGCNKSFTVYEDALLALNQHKASAIGRGANETDGTRYLAALATTTTMDSGTCVPAPIEATVIRDNGPKDGNEERVGPNGPGNDPHFPRPLVGLMLGLFILFAAIYLNVHSSR